jgi:hypothetical protein
MARLAQLKNIQKLAGLDFYILGSDTGCLSFLVIYPEHIEFKALLLLFENLKVSRHNVYFLTDKIAKYLDVGYEKIR